MWLSRILLTLQLLCVTLCASHSGDGQFNDDEQFIVIVEQSPDQAYHPDKDQLLMQVQQLSSHDKQELLEQLLRENASRASLMAPASSPTISDLTKEMCSELEAQCADTGNHLGNLFKQLDEEIKHVKNITLKHTRKEHCDIDDQALGIFHQVLTSVEDLRRIAQPGDCQGHMDRGSTTSGLYRIMVDDEELEVYCDMETDGGGWTVFQRRQDGFVRFDNDWQDYKHGFGYKDEEHWLGNEILHKITTKRNYSLWIDLKDVSGDYAYAMYDDFKIGSECEKYTLSIGSYSGNASDTFRSTYGSNYVNAGMKFSTPYEDNDKNGGNCADYYPSGWWFSDCGSFSNLNARWNEMSWSDWKRSEDSITFSEMKIRPVVT